MLFYPRNKVVGYFYTIPFVNKLKVNPGVKYCQSYWEFCAGGRGRLCWLKRTSGHRNAGARSCWSSQCVLECSRAGDHGQGAHSICSVFTRNSRNGSEGGEVISLFFFFMILLKGSLNVEYFIIIIFCFWNMSKFPIFRLLIFICKCIFWDCLQLMYFILSTLINGTLEGQLCLLLYLCHLN